MASTEIPSPSLEGMAQQSEGQLAVLLFTAILLAIKPSGNHRPKRIWGAETTHQEIPKSESTALRRSSWQAPQRIPRSVWPRSPPRSGAFPARGARPCPRVGRADLANTPLGIGYAIDIYAPTRAMDGPTNAGRSVSRQPRPPHMVCFTVVVSPTSPFHERRLRRPSTPSRDHRPRVSQTP